MHPYDIIFVGLALDLVGAVVLAKGFMFKKPQHAYFESLAVVGANLHVLRSALVQRAEARVGAGLLVTGFLLQIWGNLHGGIAANEPGWINSIERVVLLLLGAGALGYVSLRVAVSLAMRRFFQIAFRNWEGGDKGNIVNHPGDPTFLARVGVTFDLKRHRHESDEAFLVRLNERQVELGRRFGGKDAGLILE